MQLSYLCFVDDLLIFSCGSTASVRCVRNTLSLFGAKSGLHMKALKSEIFFGVMSDEEEQAILEDTGFSRGHLPICYLGVPLLL